MEEIMIILVMFLFKNLNWRIIYNSKKLVKCFILKYKYLKVYFLLFLREILSRKLFGEDEF